ncbi:hypothetical protein Taro_050617 [Colocasia esculenta]|uniref:Uncharacterized protein n=1 Tax=Colocasia esculenta TaxID=4460 RepID=A0A843XEF0_COLES|nr:hypothetical protein [Colocasia esculenta]
MEGCRQVLTDRHKRISGGPKLSVAVDSKLRAVDRDFRRIVFEGRMREIIECSFKGSKAMAKNMFPSGISLTYLNIAPPLQELGVNALTPSSRCASSDLAVHFWNGQRPPPSSSEQNSKLFIILISEQSCIILIIVPAKMFNELFESSSEHGHFIILTLTR